MARKANHSREADVRRALSTAALTIVFVSPALTFLAFGDRGPGTPAPAGAGPADAPGRGSPLEARLVGVWVSVADDSSTLEYTADGRLIERTGGSGFTARFRVTGPNQYEVYDPGVGHAFRFTVQFPDPDRMTLTGEGGMQTEWRRARDPG